MNFLCCHSTGCLSSSFFSSCDYLDLANCLNVFFVDVLASWYFAIQTLTVHLAFVDADELWEARVSDYSNDVLDRGHQCKHVIASLLELDIGVEDL